MATEQRKLTKTQLVESFSGLPDDATVEDFVEHLAFILGVEQGIADLNAGRSVSHAGLLDRIKHWQS